MTERTPMTDAELFVVRNCVASEGRTFRMGPLDTRAILARLDAAEAERDAAVTLSEALSAGLDAITAERDAAKRENLRLSEIYHSPIGDNHHNAARCPYCHPTLSADGIAEGERRATAAIVEWLLNPRTAKSFADDETLSEDPYVRIGLACLVMSALVDRINSNDHLKERGE